MPRTVLIAIAFACFSGSLTNIDAARAQDATWRLLRPSNSGIPGEEIRTVDVAPDGRVWVGARWPFWAEGGIGVLAPDTDIWKTWADWETDLPSPFINDVAFAPDGTAWIATGQGLVKIQGDAWTIYDAGNSPLPFDTVVNLSIAPDGHVWLNNSSSNFGGDAVWEFDGDAAWTSHAVPGELPWPAPWSDLSDVLVGSDGRVWVANEVLDGLAVYDGTSWTLHGGDQTRFDKLAEGTDGRIWAAGNLVGGDDAYFVFDGASFTRYPMSEPVEIAVDPEDGAIYVGNWFGTVLRSADQGATWNTYLSGLNIITEIAPQPDSGDVWIGTLGAVGRFKSDGQLVRDYNSYNTGLPWYWIDHMTTAADGHFWIATDESGLSRFDGAVWRNWGTHNAGAEPYPFENNDPMGAVHRDAAGRHWFGGNGIARWDETTGGFTGFWNWENNPGMGVGLWVAFAEDAAGLLFSVEEHGAVYAFDPQQELWVRQGINPYAPLGIPGMVSDSQGRVWLPDWFNVHFWDGTQWSQAELPYNDYFFDLGNINCVAMGTDDALWIGTGEGLVRYDGTQFALFDTQNSPLPAGNVRSIDVRSDGLVALSAADGQNATGVALISGDPADPASWTVHTPPVAPLPHWQLDAVAFDPAGDLWISALSMGVAILELDLGTTGAQDLPALAGPRLLPPAPNPFNPRTQLNFTVPAGGATIALDVVDARGRQIRRLAAGPRAGGRHALTWDGRDDDGRDAASGVYFARLRSGQTVDIRKLVLVR